MFAGHIGAALAIGRAERRVNVGVFVAAALLLDIALWVFILLGWETAVIPAEFAATHQPRFEFPLSHGLAAALAWSCAAAVLARPGLRHLGDGAWRAAALVGAAVFSHWLLDALVHARQLPLLGSDSPKVGLALWGQPVLGLGVEVAIVLAALWRFVPGAPLARAKKIGLVAAGLALAAFTVAGMTVAPPPPSATAMAASSLATLALVCALFGWLGRRPS